MTNIQKAFENIWKVRRFNKNYKEDDKARYYEFFLDGYGCAVIDVKNYIKEIKDEFMRKFYGSAITTKEYDAFLKFIDSKMGDKIK